MIEFTPEMARTMTPEEIIEFWKARQRTEREYDCLIDAETGEIIATV